MYNTKVNRITFIQLKIILKTYISTRSTRICPHFYISKAQIECYMNPINTDFNWMNICLCGVQLLESSCAMNMLQITAKSIPLCKELLDSKLLSVVYNAITET